MKWSAEQLEKPYGFTKTVAFLKRQYVGYTPKKSKVLTPEQVTRFICEAPDQKWLWTKDLLIFGVFGACRRDYLIRLTVHDVEDNGRFLVVFLRDGKNHRSRSFTITDEGCSFQSCSFYRKYINLRPEHMKSSRLFVSYRNDRCYAQHVACHTIGGVVRQIAEYLNLENPKGYTGHGLRRSSATMLVESGGDTLTLKRHGGWRSSAVAESYIQESLQRKLKVSRQLFNNCSTVNMEATAPPQSTETVAMLETKVHVASANVYNVAPSTSMSTEDLITGGLNITNNSVL